MSDPIGSITVKPDPDPTDRTMETLNQQVESIKNELTIRSEVRQREHYTLQELLEFEINAAIKLFDEKVGSIRREISINEAHRLELKSDSEKTLNTATIAAEKAVQAALAAAEKARDQQTIASQLATTKAEEASKEQMKQQGETFSTDVRGLTLGLNDVKSLVGELRAERRGSTEYKDDRRASNGLIWAVVGILASLFFGVNGLILGGATLYFATR